MQSDCLYKIQIYMKSLNNRDFRAISSKIEAMFRSATT